MVEGLEASVGSFRFVYDIPNPISESETMDERRHDDSEIKLCDDSDIQMVDR